MKKVKDIWRKALAVIACIAMVCMCYFNVFSYFNTVLSDYLFQSPKVPERNVIILGIDDKSIDDIGQYSTWTRSLYAALIDKLNNSAQGAPAVIGFDILFMGYKDYDDDIWLAEEAACYDNIVMGTMASFSSEIDTDTLTYHADVVDSYKLPFDELNEVVTTGFMNNFLSNDGVARTSLMQLTLPDGSVVDSLSLACYKKYLEKTDRLEELNELPTLFGTGSWYLEYSGGPGAIESYSISDLIYGELDDVDFSDTIVLVGPYAQGLADSFLTSIDHGSDMYGVEIHGNAIKALINKSFHTPVSNLVQAIILLVICVACILVFRKVKISIATIIAFACAAGYVGIAKLVFNAGPILQVVYVPLFVIAIYIAIVAINYITARLEKLQVMNTFKKYVAPQVVDEIMKEGVETLELGGRMTDIAALFVDIRGFTPMSELLDPPSVVELLNNYLNLTTSCILQNGGTLDKFIGDATMAIYNAPMKLDDYIFKAVKTGWDMAKGSKELGAMLLEKYGRSVNFGIGVHCGKAVVGNIGNSMRMDYTAIGNTVNTAARLEANAGPGNILISDHVYDVLRDRVRAESLGKIKLKGKSEDLEIFTVTEMLIDGVWEKRDWYTAEKTT